MDLLTWGIGLGATLLLCGLYARKQSREENRTRQTIEEVRQAGLVEPPSLHPVIDDAACIGCGTCVSACPEGKILGLVDGVAALVEPTRCIGHGACKTACPQDAITLVFGTETRGVDIPTVKPNFETNVPGMFIAGELGGMGLIRNAIEQGKQAIDSVRAVPGVGQGKNDCAVLDVLIVGAGPAGFAASLASMQHGLRYRTVEQDTLGGTVAHFPRGKLVMTAPVNLPVVGKVRMTETTKEKLLAFWTDVEGKTGVQISYQERVEDVRRNGNLFDVQTSRGSYKARTVLLAVGRRGTPRKLGVPGEEQTKVTYRLLDPEQYRGQHVLVVGGGDSALEAACSIADEPGTTVTLSYRSDAFGRAKTKNRERVESAQANGRLKVMLGTTVAAIGKSAVRVKAADGTVDLPNQAVIVCAGGILPTGFLKSIGIEVETKHGTV